MRNTLTTAITLIQKLIILGLLIFSSHAFSIDWQSLSGEEQKVLKPFANKWSALPEIRQQKLRRAASRWKSLNPKQKKRLKKTFSKPKP